MIGLDPLSRFLDCHHTYINASRVLVRIKLIEVLFFNYFNKRLAKTKRVVRSLLQLKASLILSHSFPSPSVLLPPLSSFPSILQFFLDINLLCLTKGPLDRTVVDFWRLVWQEKVCAVVMLTKLQVIKRRELVNSLQLVLMMTYRRI